MGRAVENRTVSKRFDFGPGGVMYPEESPCFIDLTPPQPSPPMGRALSLLLFHRLDPGLERAAGDGRGDRAFEAVRADRRNAEHPVVDADALEHSCAIAATAGWNSL